MKKAKATFFDRFAVALLSAVLAFVTSGLILVTVYLMFGYSEVVWQVGLNVVWGFTAVMAIIGFTLMYNLVAEVMSKLWRLIVDGWAAIS